METHSLKMVYFSPTGTTKAVIQAIVNGINPTSIELIDITKPNSRKQRLQTSENDLLVVGIPVYMGRVPALLNDWLEEIKAHNTPVVCVVVYGNRAYDSALLKLKEIVKKCGCIPIACAAFIGEHSYSNFETPIAQGRPDKDDLIHAEIFGRKICKKLKSISAISQASDFNLSGIYPYCGITGIWNVNFIEVNNQCIKCGTCADVCPMGAIDSQDSKMIDQVKCITCCACIKNCSQGARKMKPSPVKDVAKKLSKLYKERKKPEYFL